MSLKMFYVSSIFCNMLSWFAPIFFLNINLALVSSVGTLPVFFSPLGLRKIYPNNAPVCAHGANPRKTMLKVHPVAEQGDINGANPLQQAKEGWHWQTHLKTIPLSCPHHQALAWFAPSICVPNMEFQQAEGVGVGKRVSKQFFVLIKPLPDLRPIFGAFFLARMKGDAPSMWHILAGRLKDLGRYEGFAPSM